MNDAWPFIWRTDRTSTPGWCIGRTKYVMPRCLGTSQSVRARSSPKSAWCALVLHSFCPLTIHSSPSRARARREPGEVGSVPGFAEQLAPRVLAGHRRAQEPLPSRRRSRVRGASVPRARTRRRTACSPRPTSAISWATISSAHGGRSRPCHARGHDGHAQPASTSRPRHSTSDSDGSQCAVSHARTSARTASGVDSHVRVDHMRNLTGRVDPVSGAVSRSAP